MKTGKIEIVVESLPLIMTEKYVSKVTIGNRKYYATLEIVGFTKELTKHD